MVTLGPVVSATMMVLNIFLALPAASTLRYSIVYVPVWLVLTDPERTNDPVAQYIPVRVLPVPSTLSDHEAHASV